MDRFDVSSFYRSTLIVAFALAATACDGGCSGCEECGITPIPGAYPLEHRIDDSAQVRLTSSGIQFIEDNIAAIVMTFMPDGLDFDVDRQEVDAGITITICEDNDCTAHLEIDSLEISPTDPNVLRAHIELILDSRNRAGERDRWNGTCDLDLDSRRGSRPIVGFDADIRFAGIPVDDPVRAARQGYTEVIVENATLAPGQGIEDEDIRISGGFLGSCGALNLGFIKNFIIDMVEDQVDGLVDDAVNDALCQTRGEYGCPTGTFSVPDENPDSTCRFENNEDAQCVPILLGSDGRGDLGGNLIGGFSPGTHAYIQFLLASGGDGEAVNEGMSLFFYGGFMGMDRTFTETPAHNPCVPIVEPPPLPEIPRAAAFRANTIPGSTTETHLGIGIAEDYMDYAGYGFFDSGALCIGAGTRLSQQLSTGLVSAAIMSLPELTFPEENAALTIAVRPQLPPDFTVGTGTGDDPLLTITLPQAQMDFYVWSTERYVRFMTFQTDLVISMNLVVEDGQIVPMILGVEAENSMVTNSELLAERPEALAGTLETVISSFAGMLTSGISPIDLPEIMGFNLEVPEGGITQATEGEDRFLAIFANLALAGPMPYSAPVETTVEVSDLELDRTSMNPETWAEGDGNRAWLHFAAEGPLGVEYEYSYRIDGGPWSAWTTDERIQIADEILLLQARHEIEARARVAGEPLSVDASPARAELVVDILPPTVVAERTYEGIEVDATDVVSPQDALEYRFLVNGSWTAWTAERAMPLEGDAQVELVEARDEAGNVGRSQQALIRGLPNAASGDGCGCAAPGAGSKLPLGALALLGLFGLALTRRRAREVPRRRRRLPFLSLFSVIALSALLASGCECGDPMDPPGPCSGGCPPASPPADTSGEICCEAMDMCVAYDVDDLCDPGFTCPVDNVTLDGSCGVSCSACEEKPPLPPGQLATHLDAVIDDAGNVFVSGYSPGTPGLPYGDLVFGPWNGTEVDWEIVDGAPEGPVARGPSGWRGGVVAPGDDVGQWTSMVRQDGSFLIAYYDVGNGALKLAIGGPGGAWATHTVDATGDSGRYASLVLTDAGVPVVSYLRISEDTETPGNIRSAVMVATANIGSPASETDWTITEVAAGPMACRPQFCGLGTTCIEDGQCVTPTSDCSAECTGGDVCFNGSCRASLPMNYVEDMPPALGLYTSLADMGGGQLALVYYDRSAGNVHGVHFDGAAWGAPFLIDGYARMDPDVGDSGMSADLFIDAAGLWHVAYVDGTEETLRYAQVQADGTVVTREVVDDGSTDGTERFTDGRHIVGDDASLVVDEAGGVRVVYQDATAQDAVVAVRPAGGGDWAILHFDTEGSTGYWLEQELLGSVSYAVMWWRQREMRNTLNGVRVIPLE